MYAPDTFILIVEGNSSISAAELDTRRRLAGGSICCVCCWSDIAVGGIFGGKRRAHGIGAVEDRDVAELLIRKERKLTCSLVCFWGGAETTPDVSPNTATLWLRIGVDNDTTTMRWETIEGLYFPLLGGTRFRTWKLWS